MDVPTNTWYFDRKFLLHVILNHDFLSYCYHPNQHVSEKQMFKLYFSCFCLSTGNFWKLPKFMSQCMRYDVSSDDFMCVNTFKLTCLSNCKPDGEPGSNSLSTITASLSTDNLFFSGLTNTLILSPITS